MADVLILGDTFRSPELRHEVPLGIGDPFLYAERNGTRHVVVSALEAPRLRELDGFEVHPFEEFGLDELRRSGKLNSREVLDEVMLRAVQAIGVEHATIPWSFPVLLADRLRAAGVELTPEREPFERRRRVKSGPELAGVRRAQAAAEAGMTAARDLLRRARPADGGLEANGEALTSERVKAAIAAAFLAQGATWDEFIVSRGPQAAVGHHMGEGRLQAGEPIVIDLWPRDPESSCSADMTRTFVVGDVPAEVAEWHRLCTEALEGAIEAIRPGITGRSLYDRVCDLFEGAGYPTQRTKEPGVTLEDGFFHSLGHGVGLEVHEEPPLGMTGYEELVAGDVLAVEPGLYRAGYGGCRLEDLVLVTEDGAENLTRFPYDLEP